MPYAPAITAVVLTVFLPLAIFLLTTAQFRAEGVDELTRRRETGHRIARLTVATTVATYLCAIWLGWLAYGYASREPVPGFAGALAGVLSAVDMAVMLWAALGVYLLLPGVVGLLMAIGPTLRWRDPARILVLRRFGRDDASQALKTLLADQVAPLGHVYTLADQDIRIPWYVRLPVVFAQLVFFHFRSRRIRSPKMLQRLLRQAEVRWARNINWFVSWSKTFPVHSSDAMWQECVLALGTRADLVLIDVTAPSDNLAWEIDAFMGEGLWDRVILLTDNAHAAQSREFLARWPGGADRDRLIVHDAAGTPLQPLLLELIGRRKRTDGAGQTRVSAGSHLRTALSMIGPIGFAALAFFALIAHDVAVDYFSEDETARRHLARLHDPASRERAFDRLLEMAGRNTDHELWHWEAEDQLALLWQSAPDARLRVLDLAALVGGMRSEALWLTALRELPEDAIALRRRVIADWRTAARRGPTGNSDFVDSTLLDLLDDRLAGGMTRPARTPKQRNIDLMLIESIERNWPGRRLETIAACDLDAGLREAAHAKIEQLEGGRHFINAVFFRCHAVALEDARTTELALERLLDVLRSGTLNGRRFDVNRAFARPVSDAMRPLWREQPTLRPRLRSLAQLIGGSIAREFGADTDGNSR